MFQLSIEKNNVPFILYYYTTVYMDPVHLF